MSPHIGKQETQRAGLSTNYRTMCYSNTTFVYSTVLRVNPETFKYRVEIFSTQLEFEFGSAASRVYSLFDDCGDLVVMFS